MNQHLPEHEVNRQAEAARDLLLNISDDDADLCSDMIEGSTDLFEAIDAAIDQIRECGIIVSGCKAEIDKLNARKLRAEGRENSIRAAIEQAMTVTGLETILRPTKTLSLTRRPGKAVITEESEIPAEFYQPQPPKLNKSALNAAVAEREIPGAHLGNGIVSLTIRSK